MQTATIDVSFVNPPKPGKKMGSVKTRDDDFYLVFPEDLAKFSPGQTYQVNYETNNFNGTDFKTIKFPKTRQPSRVPAKANGHTQSVEMFVMGTIGRCLQGAGTFPEAAQLTEWVRDARKAWEDGFSDTQEEETPF